MAFMEWNPALSVGHATLDEDHKRLISIVNRLHDAMIARQGGQEVGAVLADLVAYAKTHFELEESLMQSSSYPNYMAHRLEHEKLLQQTQDLQRRQKAGSETITLETMDFLRGWLFNHFMQVDQRLGQWLANPPI